MGTGFGSLLRAHEYSCCQRGPDSGCGSGSGWGLELDVPLIWEE